VTTSSTALTLARAVPTHTCCLWLALIRTAGVEKDPILNGPTVATSRPVTSGQSRLFAPLVVVGAELVVAEEREGLGWTKWLPRSQLVRMSSPLAADATGHRV